MEITGKIIAALEPRSGVSQRSGNAWKVQEFVIETQNPHDQFPRKCCFEVFGEDRLQQFAIKVGEELTISFDIDAREWTGNDGRSRWTNQLRAWRVVRPTEAAASPAAVAPASPAAPAAPAAPAPDAITAPSVGDDYSTMPF